MPINFTGFLYICSKIKVVLMHINSQFLALPNMMRPAIFLMPTILTPQTLPVSSQSGEIDIVNHTTGDRCHLKFAPYSYFSRDVARKVRKKRKRLDIFISSFLFFFFLFFRFWAVFLCLVVYRWQEWWWTRTERPTMCCRARGTRRWSSPGSCRAVGEERTAPRANRRPYIKPWRPESCGRETLYRKWFWLQSFYCKARGYA